MGHLACGQTELTSMISLSDRQTIAFLSAIAGRTNCYVHTNAEIAYLFLFYKNRPSVHTKPVNPVTETALFCFSLW